MSVLGTLSGGVNAVRPGRTAMPSVDVGLIVAVSALVLFGLLMVYSASIALADGPRYESYGRFYFVGRHAAFILIGMLAALFTASIPMRIWQKVSMPLFILALALLMVVLVPGIGREVNGARRWLP
ncbi:MAG: FtsW/RodA/SpoVE family cell cycle protein, partial [Castellaniella sp.]